MSSDAASPAAYEEHVRQLKEFRALLIDAGFDGPHEISGFGLFSIPREVAVCLTCGAMLLLRDAVEAGDGRMIERGVNLHVKWHEQQGA